LEVLVEGKLRAKIPALKDALEGRFDHLHAVWIGAILAQLDFLDEQIAHLAEAIGGSKSPFEKAVELLCPTPVATTSPRPATLVARNGKAPSGWIGRC
jgi:transposase